MTEISGIGELAAVSAAAFWCIATLLYERLGQEITPLAMNLFKGLIALVMMLVVMISFGMAFSAMPTSVFLLLIISGILGIGIGDTLYFITLKELGSRVTLLLATLAPPLTVLIAWIFLSRGLSMMNMLGIAITMVGIVWVITERTAGEKGHRLSFKGLMAGFGASFCQAAGSTLSFQAFETVELGALWTAVIRMVAGLIVLLLILPLMRSQFALAQVRQTTARFWKLMVFASFIGTFICIWLQQIAFKYTTNPGVAQTLLCASPVLILPLSAWRGEAVTRRAILGALVAFSGIAVLLLV
jgi:drug/metabolite transporter (DMT)-like permease